MNRSWGNLAVLLLGGLFVTGLIQLILLRFESGDVYPPYFSLRADPLGCKALYESLGRVADLQVRRNFRPWEETEMTDQATVIFAGFDPWEFEYGKESHRRALLDRVAHGARMIIAFHDLPMPELAERTEERLGEGEANESEADPEESNETESDPEPGSEVSDESHAHYLAETLGVTVENIESEETELMALKDPAGSDSLPDELKWRSSIRFNLSNDLWFPHYSAGGSPIIVERPFGKGEVVLVADSYLLSNEGLRRDREPDVLTWLVGDQSTVVFDETHLGVLQSQGVGTLIRKYRLHTFLLGLSLVALLVIWKNSVSFLPPYEDEAPQSAILAVEGKDATEGFHNLLRRSLAPAVLLRTSFEEWEKTFLGSRHGRLIYGKRADQARRLLAEEKPAASGRRNLVKDYNQISNVLKTKGI